jgi:hypothetical protein
MLKLIIRSVALQVVQLMGLYVPAETQTWSPAEDALMMACRLAEALVHELPFPVPSGLT